MTTNDHEAPQETTEEDKRGFIIKDMAQIGAYLIKGGAGENRMEQILCQYAMGLAPQLYGKNFSKLKEDVKHASVRSDIYLYNIDGKGLQETVESWIDHQEGPFDLRSAYNELQLTTKEAKKHFRTCIYRCAEKGLIRATCKRAGEYKKIDQKLERIEIIRHEYNEYPVKLPLDLDEWVIIRPANIIIVAGEKGSGKSAFCLNTALLNMNKSGIQ